LTEKVKGYAFSTFQETSCQDAISEVGETVREERFGVPGGEGFYKRHL
jgi:hypothetical protein